MLPMFLFNDGLMLLSVYTDELWMYTLMVKLVRTCVLPGVAKIANNAPVYVTPLGGFLWLYRKYSLLCGFLKPSRSV